MSIRSKWPRCLRLCRLTCALILLLGARSSAAQDGEDGAPEKSAESEASAPDGASELNARLSAGAGIGMRSLSVPSNEGVRKLETGLLPALGVRVAGRLRVQSRFIGLRLSYQSSVHARATDQVGDRSLSPSEVAIRSHHFESGLLPGLLLSSTPNAGSLALFVGYGVRAFGTTEVLRVPRFTLHGPVLRLELVLPLASRLRLRLAPEAQLIVSMTRALRDLALLPASALSIGGEADLQVRVSPSWAVQVSYREAHVRTTGIEGKSFADAERYVLLEGTYQVE